MRFGDQPWGTVGYVEAVATAPDHQGQGIGLLVMERLHEEMASRWDIALLSTGRDTGLYELLGRERWRGISCTQTEAGLVLDGEHGGLMVWSADPLVAVDRTQAATCQDRPTWGCVVGLPPSGPGRTSSLRRAHPWSEHRVATVVRRPLVSRLRS